MQLWENVLEVAKQVLQLFLLMGAGVLCGKVQWLHEVGAKQMTNILVKLITFCVIVESFATVAFSTEKLKQMAITVGACLLCTLIGGICSAVLFRKSKKSFQSVLKFGTVFSNCGFMSLPLVSAILGAEGVFIVSIYVGVFQCLCWTYGVGIYHYFDKSKAVKQIVMNPGIIGIVVGLPIFIFKLSCPSLILQPIQMLADMNTPMAMLVTGFYLGKMTLKLQKGDGYIFLGIVFRLLIIPFSVLGILYAFGVRGFLLVACMIPICAPTASNTSLFAVLFGQDEVYASRMVSLCTLFSIITMPLVVAVAQLTM